MRGMMKTIEFASDLRALKRVHIINRVVSTRGRPPKMKNCLTRPMAIRVNNLTRSSRVGIFRYTRWKAYFSSSPKIKVDSETILLSDIFARGWTVFRVEKVRGGIVEGDDN